MSYTVYAIIDPRSQRPFYIGETGAFELRCRQHLEGTDQISGLIVRQIQENGFAPHFVVLEHHDQEETALRAEIFWIETLLARGVALTNSQAFHGYFDRKTKRKTEHAKLKNMKRLRAVANGRTAKRTSHDPGPKTRSKPHSLNRKTKDWSAAETKRLRGMAASGMAPKVMAKMLDRRVAEVRARLSEDTHA